jgi:hypothetical protein
VIETKRADNFLKTFNPVYIKYVRDRDLEENEEYSLTNSFDYLYFGE